jgi:hypothetical protein
MLEMTPNQATLIGAFGGAILGAVLGGGVSFFVAQYTVKHSVNYSNQIETINEALTSLAGTQEEMKQHYAQSVADEKKRHEENTHRIQAAMWKPSARIINVNEGLEHVNKLSINSTEKFKLLSVSLLSHAGAKVYDFPFQISVFGDSVVGKNFPIAHHALCQLANNSLTYQQSETFEGAIRYTVERDEDDPIKFSEDLKFSANVIMLGPTRWFHLVG